MPLSLVQDEPEPTIERPWAFKANGNKWFPITPRTFQVTGINWLWEQERAILSDSPGLGKTLEATYAAQPPTLVICPNYLTQQWYSWLCGTDPTSMQAHNGTIVPNVQGEVVLAVGSYYDKLLALQSEHQWCVINIEALSTHEGEFLRLAKRNWWNTVIFDESHHLRNHASKRGTAAARLSALIPRVYCLSATPIWKEVDDLFNQLRIIRPDIFKSYSAFLQQFCVTDSTRFGVKVLGVKREMLADLEELLSYLRLGRSYKEAGRELPGTINKYIKVELPPEMRKMYDSTRDYWIAQIEASLSPDGTGLLRFDNFPQVMQALRLQARGPHKYEAASSVIEEAIHPITNLGQAKYASQVLNSRKANRVVVFAWFQDTVNEAAKYFNSHIEGCKAVAISGAITNVADRRNLALNRQNNVICATIASLGEGIDLSDAHTVVFLEEHYTPGSQYQALSRVNRERNFEIDNEPVIVYYVHSKNTIDEAIHNVVMSRSGTIKEVLRTELGLSF